MVEESPGKLEYEVALFRESGAGVSGGGGGSGAESPVEQAVPIGTKLQLRATIGANSGRSVAFCRKLSTYREGLKKISIDLRAWRQSLLMPFTELGILFTQLCLS